MTKIKVKLHYGSHSVGRGVGYYAENLAKALAKFPEVELTHGEPDVIHYPLFDLFYSTLPLAKSKPTVVTIHDLTPLVLPSLYPKGIKGTINLYRQWLSLQSVKAVITDSINSKNDLIKLFHLSPKKIFVTPLAADPIFSKPISAPQLEIIKQKYNLPNKFILTVAGGPNPNKNLPALAEVTKKLKLPLVIVGKGMLQEVSKPIHPELRDLEALKQYSHLILPGFVSTEDLSAIYRLAALYCQPSLYEGFGLPVLEAMMSGCLLVSSNTASLPEIYPAATITFNPREQESMLSAIKKALFLSDSQKKELIQSATIQAASFTWKKTAALTLPVYQSVLGL